MRISGVAHGVDATTDYALKRVSTATAPSLTRRRRPDSLARGRACAHSVEYDAR